jgi:hypothetical protein
MHSKLRKCIDIYPDKKRIINAELKIGHSIVVVVVVR